MREENFKDIKVTIIAPIYNVSKYLANCIESIINQTYHNLEIILVNDGSKDNSGEIADEYAKKDSRIRVIHQQNKGVSSARNAGIEAATGDYICFTDSDDYLKPDYVEYLLNMAVENDADISLTTEMFTNYYLDQISNDRQMIYSPEKATIEILCYNIPIGVYCKMFRRSFLGNEIRFIPSIYIGEGFNFNTAAFQRANKIAVGHRRIYFYRRNNPNSAVTKFAMEKWVNGLMAIDNIKKDFILHTKAVNTAWEYARWHTNSDVVNFIHMASAEKQYPEMYKKCKHIARTKAYYAFLVPITFREKIRAIIMMVWPKLMPMLYRWRSKRHNVKFDE